MKIVYERKAVSRIVAAHVTESKATGISNCGENATIRRLKMKTFYVIVALFMLAIISVQLYPVLSGTGQAETVIKNSEWAAELHQASAERDDYAMITSEWDLDWVLNYIATREIISGQPVSVDVPDIRTRWQNGEYQRR